MLQQPRKERRHYLGLLFLGALSLLGHRTVMGNDVSVGMFGGALDIDGDEAGNAIKILALSNGQFEVRGLYIDGQLTRLNGDTDPVVVSHVKSMSISLKGGDDRLYIRGSNSGSTLSEELHINAGGGGDRVEIDDLSASFLNIEMDSPFNLSAFGLDQSQGDDHVYITNVQATDSYLNIETLDGNDRVELVGEENEWVTALNIAVQTGFGEDEIFASQVFASNQLVFSTGHDADTIIARATYSYTGSTYLHTTYYAGMSDGDDVIQYLDSVSKNLYVKTGGGNDLVTIANVTTRGTIDVRTGYGNDTVTMSDASVNDVIYADLASNDDDLILSHSQATVASLHGGANGRRGDSLWLSDNNFGAVSKSGWE